jgi:hypothetical protein
LCLASPTPWIKSLTLLLDRIASCSPETRQQIPTYSAPAPRKQSKPSHFDAAARGATAKHRFITLEPGKSLFILPSKSEATSLSIIEAVAKALPVVATGVDGILELIDETCGILLPLDEDASIRAIAQAVDRLTCDHDLRTRLCDAARNRAEQFRVRSTVARYVDLLADVLRCSPRSSRSIARTIVPVGAAVDFATPRRYGTSYGADGRSAKWKASGLADPSPRSF